MNYGYVRVATAIPDIKVADCKYNAGRIIYLINEAVKNDVQIIAFPELSITAYTCGDLFYQQLLIESAEEQLNELLTLTSNTKIIIIVGMPVKTNERLFNCAVVLQSGTVLAAIPKSYIHSDYETCEKRWFSSFTHATCDTVNLCKQQVPFGPKILFKDPPLCFNLEVGEELYSPVPPSSYHCLNGANIIFNISAGSEAATKNDYLKKLITLQSARCMTGYVYVSPGGSESTTDAVFAGYSMIAENGSIIGESERFSNKEQLIIREIDVDRIISARQKSANFIEMSHSDNGYKTIECTLKPIDIRSLQREIDPHPFVPTDIQKRNERCDEIFSIQIAGLIKRLRHTGAKCAVIGISGGLDSTLALLVTTQAFNKLKLPRNNILGITMPGFGTTSRTHQNSISLMKHLGITIREIDIKDACLQHFRDIGHNPDIHDITYENTQARERTQILMDIANKENGFVIGTGDLSELALGWTTYNGDHMSMYAVNVGVPKTLIRFIIQWVAENITNADVQKTLLDILDTPVSPELLPADSNGDIKQKTEDIIGPYELHDFFLYHMIRFGFTPEKILFLAATAFKDKYPKSVIIKWLKVFYRRFFTQQYKRSCLPDGPKIGSVNLSPRGHWRMPSDASYCIWMDRLENLCK